MFEMFRNNWEKGDIYVLPSYCEAPGIALEGFMA